MDITLLDDDPPDDNDAKKMDTITFKITIRAVIPTVIMITVVIWNHLLMILYWKRLVPAQDRPFFYTRSHLSALQNCALLFSTDFQFIFIFKKSNTQFIH